MGKHHSAERKRNLFAERELIWESILSRYRYVAVILALAALIVTIAGEIDSLTLSRVAVFILVFVLALIFLFAKSIPVRIKVRVICGLTYLAAINSLVHTGFYGGAALWLITFCVLSASLFSKRFGVIAVAISFLTLLAFTAYTVVNPDAPTTPKHQTVLMEGMENSFDMLLLAFIATIPTSTLLHHLETSLRKEKDLTRQKQQLLEKVTAANEGLKTYSYSISHDLRSPINRIANWAELIQDDLETGKDEMLKKGMPAILASVEHMNSIIEGLLTLSRVERDDLSIKQVNLSLAAQSILHGVLSAPDFRKYSIEIQPDLIAETDENLVQILLQNLFENAVKFSRDVENPKIEFGVEVREDSSPCYYVRDNGMGFSMQEKDMLFVPHQRLSNSKLVSGMGIGLSIARRAVQRLGGAIEAVSTPGRGATFYFTIPTPSQPMDS